MALTRKQERFVAEYLKDLNATQAAIRAGYPAKSAASVGSENLMKPEIASAVQVLQAQHLKAADLSATRTLEEIRRLAFADLRKLFDANGNLKPIHEMDDEAAATIASLEIVKKNLEAGDGKQDTVHKLKVWDKTRSLEMLAKHFGLLEDKVAHSGHLTIGFENAWQPPPRP